MARPREPLPRLSIPPQNMQQQPMGFGGGQPMFSPALPSALQQNFHPPFLMNKSMQTPMQPFFPPQPPPAPGRPTHHIGHPSMAHLTAAGIIPASGFPVTPVGGHFSRPSMMGIPGQQFIGGQPSAHPFSSRNRRQLSIGGPPKAVLGGPARKLSPLPIAVANTPPPAAQKVKKVNVNLPKETIPGEDGQPPTRPPWARTPLDDGFVHKDQEVVAVETTTAESHFPDAWRSHVPLSIGVFLPGKHAWDSIKHQAIEEKLERLGVERGSGSNVPHILAPHARAASISSPADPALLLFKLNKLQQAQESANNSLSTSPQPPYGLSPPPNRPPPRFVTNRHGHSMSLAQPPYLSFFDHTVPAFNPFGHNATMGFDHMITSPGPVSTSFDTEGIHAPQGRVPVVVPSLAPPPPLSAIGPDTRPDFIRGFGLDIPEEEEEGEGAEEEQILNVQEDMVGEEENADEEGTQPVEGTATALQSRHHSRHVSKISAALSLRSINGLTDLGLNGSVDEQHGQDENQADNGGVEDMDLEDAVAEWTGSEDVYLGTEISEDDESIGEWSNPSDEEQARQQRAERRLRRRNAQQVDKPRRLPNFPRPPENTIALPLQREDDMISNPSEEKNARMEHHGDYLGVDGRGYFSRPPSNLSGTSRPLPPLPHSPVPSTQLSAHDPAQAHSRTPSDNFVYPSDSHQVRSASIGSRRDSLNPFAKPFVFGAPRESGSLAQGSSNGIQTPPNAPFLGHSRLPSLGKPLNVSAPEFKPSGFTFRPPPGVPQMPTFPPALGFHRPLPQPPIAEGSPFRLQGREKRQRRGSSASVEEGDSMASFRFPQNVESPRSICRDPSPRTNDSHTHKLNPSAEPFTFARFSAVATLPYVSKESDEPSEPLASTSINTEEALQHKSSTEENGQPHVDEFHLPSTTKPKRAPIPLDFKHPVSNNTVPAGLFKALVNSGDERTRRTVRSRLSSREIYEHSSRPSMDDANVPQISHNVSRSRLVTDPGKGQASPPYDVFSSARRTRRRSSLPDALHDDGASLVSDLTGRMEMHQYERRLGALLDGKLSVLGRELKKEAGGQHLSIRSMISDVVSLFRTQLQESASRSLEDSQMDARGEMDFQLVKDIVEEGHKELLGLLRRELGDLVDQLQQTRAPSESSSDVVPVIEQVGNRTIKAVIEAISELSARQEAISRVTPGRERDALVDKLMAVLTPVLSTLRAEPIDYDFLTGQLTQAVKPHISQLIDLASDKRETAGLIVDRLIPLLPSMNGSTFDTEAVILQLTTEVRRAIAPIDAFEIKEQVADLVVERLDSRLAVRDKVFNVDNVTSKVIEGVSRFLEPVQDIPASVGKLMTFHAEQSNLSSAHNEGINLVSGLLSKLDGELQALQTTQNKILFKVDQPAVIAAAPEPDENILHIKTTVDALTSQQKTLALHNELTSNQKDILGKLNALPDSLLTATTVIQELHVESYEATKRELDELRKLNTEYQIQVTKARGAHGQVRVEKDVLSEKLAVVESDRERLRGQAKELQSSVSAKAAEVVTLEARNSELEEALAQALARLQASDVATQANQERLTELEKANRDFAVEKQALKSKVDSLDLQITFASRDRESAVQALTVLQKQHDDLLSQQSHWADLRQASEKIDVLTNLIGQADNEELKELRRYRDRSKVLEGEHAALQKRFKEQESKIMNSERAALTARQSLAQAQQRSSEWERRAKEYEGQLELTQTKLDQAEQTQVQLDADYSLVKLQMEEREADDRLVKDQQNKVRDQIAALEAKIVHLQTELEQAKAEKTPTTVTTSLYRHIANGNTHPLPRPDSRASTVYDVTPPQHRHLQSQTSSIRSDTPPQASVWDSMHAPTNDAQKRITSSIHAPNARYPYLGPATPKARRPKTYRGAAPSPTPSTISLTPTQGEDGWWS